MDIMPFDRHARAGLVLLERDYLERYAKHLGDLFRELTIIGYIIARAPQTPTDHLLAQQLRHEGPQTDDMRDRVAVPSFGQHPDAHDTAHVAPWRMQRLIELVRQRLEAIR